MVFDGSPNYVKLEVVMRFGGNEERFNLDGPK
jgi:hypothetical protein